MIVCTTCGIQHRWSLLVMMLRWASLLTGFSMEVRVYMVVGFVVHGISILEIRTLG